MNLTGETRGTRRKTCPIASISTINPTGTGLGSNPGLRHERSGSLHGGLRDNAKFVSFEKTILLLDSAR
jgi:hypothetical protein